MLGRVPLVLKLPLVQLVLDICGIDIRGFEYSRHPFHYPNAAREPNFAGKIKVRFDIRGVVH